MELVVYSLIHSLHLRNSEDKSCWVAPTGKTCSYTSGSYVFGEDIKWFDSIEGKQHKDNFNIF